MPDLSTPQWILAALGALCIGLAKGGLGGFGQFAVLLFASVLPARESTGVVLPMLIFADFMAVGAFRRHARLDHLVQLMLPAALGVVAGFFLMPRIEEASFRPLIGWIVLAMSALHYLRRARPGLFEHLPSNPVFAWFMGGLAGITTMLANAAGPVMTLYLLARKLGKYEFVGTAAVFFMGVNLFKVPFSWGLGLIGASSLLLNLALFPAIVAGIFAAKAVVARIPQRLFEEILVVFSILAAIRMVWG